MERHAPLLACLLVLLATVRIAATYNDTSRTSDEQAHLACGIEYLDKGVYRYEPQHPPLTRLMAGLLPYLDGARSQGYPSMWHEGGVILYGSGKYQRTLALARAGELPFFWVAALVVYVWGRRYFERTTAVIAVGLFTFTPTVLAHAGLATTDMGLGALCGASLLTTLVLVEKPGWRTGLLWGATLGLATTSKFSFLPFYTSSLVVAAAFWGIIARPAWRELRNALRRTMLPAGLGLLAAIVVVWGVYRFSFGPSPLTGSIPVPFPELFQGVKDVLRHNGMGHPSYLLGTRSATGFWYFYPVALFFKLPIALQVLLAAGLVWGWKARQRAVGILTAFSLAILAAGAISHINIGVRHVMPLFPLFSVLAAAGVKGMIECSRRWAAVLAAGLLVWFSAASAWSHPQYLAYFNEFAVEEPESILVDSDLDWGQDLQRAGARLRELGATSFAFWPYFPVFANDFKGFPPMVKFDPVNPVPGWNLVSITAWKAYRFQAPEGAPLWLDRARPVERVGRGMLLYYISPGAQSP